MLSKPARQRLNDARDSAGTPAVAVPVLEPAPLPGPSNSNTPGPKPLRQWPISYRAIADLIAILEVLLITGIGIGSSSAYHYFAFDSTGPVERSIAISVFAVVIFVGLNRLQKSYAPTQILLWNFQINTVIWTWCATFFLLSGWLFLWKSGDDVSRGSVILFWAVGLAAMLFHRAFWRIFIERALKKGTLRGRKIILIARMRPAIDEKFAARLRRFGYDCLGEFVIGRNSAGGADEQLTSALSFVRGSPIEAIMLVVRSEDLAAFAAVADQLRVLPLPVIWVTDGLAADLVRHPWFELGPAVAIEMQKAPRSVGERAVKRVFDIAIASCALLFSIPLLVIVAIAVKLDSPGPVLFWQTRRGFNSKLFRIAKFRTMRVLEDGDVVRQATKDDDRVTRIGSLLRRASIDEIPQLFNVLRGEMSLVGPRPHAVAHDDEFTRTVEHYAYRNHVKPGITGWAQVHGYRGETPTLEAIERRVEFDRWYIANWSVWLDLTILLRTLGELARGRNAY
jgi:putative colanic acid biosynthesis UDP-glucose lipid carrier transferase